MRENSCLETCQMSLQEFEQLARTLWHEIPQQYKQGIDGLIIEAGSRAHAEHQDFFTLGECVTEAYPSDFGGPETVPDNLECELISG